MRNDFEPEVWIGCLACYNAGTLRGEWVDARVAADFPETADVFEGCRARGHEEFWCMDHQGFEGLLDGECSPMTAQAIAEAADEIEDYYPIEAVAAYCSNHGCSLEPGSKYEFDKSDFEDSYNGTWRSEEEFAENLADDLGGIPDDHWLSNYVDYEKLARDLFMSDYWSAEGGDGIFAFRSN